MRTWVILLLLLPILSLALGARLWCARIQDRHAEESEFAPFVFPDAHGFQSYADNLAESGTYIDDQKRYAWRTPGYPLFLLSLEAIGLGTPKRVRRVQAGLDTFNCLLVFLLASILFRPGVGLLAAFFYAIYPFLIYMSGLVISETLSHTAILLSMTALAWWIVPRPGAPNPPLSGTRWRYMFGGLGVGVLLGAAVLIKTSLALLVVPVLLFLIIRLGLPGDHRLQASLPLNAACVRGRSLRAPLLVLAGWLLVMAPWWVRNAMVFEAFVPFSTMSGFTLWEATGPNADGGPNHGKVDFPPPYKDLRFIRQKNLLVEPGAPGGHSERSLARGEFRTVIEHFFHGRRISVKSGFAGNLADLELAMDRVLWSALREEFRNDPWRMIALSKRKFLRTWSPVPNWSGASGLKYTLLMLFSYGPVMLLAAYALWRYRNRWREVGLLLIPVLYLALLHSVIMGSIRYRLPAMGCLIVLAAGGVGILLDWIILNIWSNRARSSAK